MTDSAPRARPRVFCDDEELGYVRDRSRFANGQGLILDETYRLAHLPLVAPLHPAVMPSKVGSYYRMGRHPCVVSLVVAILGDALFGSPAYQQLDAELRAAPFAHKLLWDLIEARKSKLHATLCSSLSVGYPYFGLDEAHRSALKQIGTFRIQIRGIFSGNINVGRLYLRLYPERRDGANVFHHVQRAMQCRTTDLHLVGLHNFTDDLTAAEAMALSEIMTRWWDVQILDFEVDHLNLLGALDDLVLDSPFRERVPLA